MSDTNELPAYLRASQPAPAPLAQQPAPMPTQQTSAPMEPLPAQPVQEQLPAYMQDQGAQQPLAQPPAQSSGVDSEGFAPLTDSQVKALTKPASATQAGGDYVPAYLKGDAGGQTNQTDQADPNLLHKLFGKTVGNYAGYALDIAPFFIPVVGEVAGATGLAIRGGTAIGDFLAEKGLLNGVNKVIEKTLASHIGRGAVEGAAFGAYDSGNRYIQGHEFTPVTSTLEGAALGGGVGTVIGGFSRYLGRAGDNLGSKVAAGEKTERAVKGEVDKADDVNYNKLNKQAESVALNEQSRVPIYTSDALPPQTAAFKELRKTADHFPVLGTARLRVKQQAAREALVNSLKEHFSIAGYDNDKLVNQIINGHKRVIDTTGKRIADFSDKLSGKPTFQQNSINAIDSQIQELTTPEGVLRQNADADLVNKLQSASDSIKADPSFENMQRIRTDLQGVIRGDSKGLLPPAQRIAATAVRDGLDADLRRTVEQHLGANGLKRWNATNVKLDQHLDDIKRSALQRILNRENITPNVAEDLLNSASDQDRAAIKGMLTAEGRRMALSGIINNAISKSLDANGKISATALAENISKREGSINNIATPKEQNFLNGVANVLMHTARAQEAEGSELANKIFSWAAIPATLLHPLAGAPGAGASIYMHFYESAPARAIISSLAKHVGPDVMNKRLVKLGKMMGLGKNAEGLQQETFGAARAARSEPNFATYAADDATNTAGWASDANVPTQGANMLNAQPGIIPGQIAGAGAAGVGLIAAGNMPTQSFANQQTAMPVAPVGKSQGIQSQQMQQLPPIQDSPSVQPQQVQPQQLATQPVTPTHEAMTRGQRLNNPLNIRSTGAHGNQWRGKVADSGGFVKFDSIDHGIRASVKVLKTYRKKGLTTITGIINRFAPAGDGNDPQAYAQTVSQMTGISPNRPLTPADYPSLIRAMGKVESGAELNLDRIADLWQKTK